MRLFFALMLVVIAALLGWNAYEIRRSTWAPEDQACWTPFSSQVDEQSCRIARWNAEKERERQGDNPVG